MDDENRSDLIAGDSTQGEPLPGAPDVTPLPTARPLAERIAALREQGITRSAALRRWVQLNTFTPRWLPERLRHPVTGYGVTLVLEVVTVLLDLLLVDSVPHFETQGVLPLLVVACVALTFGMGPSIAATLLSALLFELVIVPPHFGFSGRSTDVIQVTLLLLVGGGISLVAGRTERSRQLAEALAESEQAKQARLEAIFTAVPSLISIYDARGRLIESNRPQTAEPGSTEKDTLAELMARQPAQTLAKPVARALRGETLSGVETTLRDEATGEERIVLVSVAPLGGDSGAIEGAVVAARDVTIARRADRATAALADELDAIVRTVPDAVMVFGADGRILRMNPAARSILSLSGDETFYALPQHTRGQLTAVYDESDQPLPLEEWPYTRILRGEVLAGSDAVDIIYHKPGAPQRELSVIGAPLLGEDGSIIAAVCVIRDVTERRRLERRTHQALDALLEMAHALVQLPADAAHESEPEPTSQRDAQQKVARRLAELTCDVLGCKRVGITAVEPETERLRFIAVVGLAPEQEAQWWAEQRALEEQGMRLDDAIAAEELARFRAGEPFVLDMTEPRFRDLPNPYAVATTLIAPMRLRESVVGMLSLDYAGERHRFIHDEVALTRAIAQFCAVVLERERLLRERETAEAHVLALTEINLQLDTFLGMAGHELKTPLTTSVVNTQLARRRLERLRAEIARLVPEDAARIAPHMDTLEELVARVAGAGERETRLVNDLLDVTRIQANRLELTPDRFDLVALARDVVSEQQANLPQRTITLEAPEEPLPVHADADRIRQVITNYLTNALKYSPVSEPVTVRLVIEDCCARLCVTDTGQGIPAEEQERIWDRFHRAPGIEVASGSGVGLGLGLYICRQIIERHDGSVGLWSAPGQGSTFWFTLPLAGE